MSKVKIRPNCTKINIGILGLGTVGSGTINVLKENYDDIYHKTGLNIVIKKVAVKNLKKPRICSLKGITITSDVYDIITDPEIDIIIELIGGIELTKNYMLEAISYGKHIVTANKALIATYGNEIFAYAQEKNVIIAFEAAVGGGIPIIKILRESLIGNKIKTVMGILNGTGNFVLTKMYNEGIGFDEALNLAQRLGYAEFDPSADIGGIDAAYKIAILSSIAFGTPLCYSSVYIEGISGITHYDLLCAKKMGYTIKHIAYTGKICNNIELFVYPMLINSTHRLAKVDGVTNAIVVNATATGDSIYSGAGAGMAATASSVIADIIDLARGMKIAPEYRLPNLSFHQKSLKNYDINSTEIFQFSYYIRLSIKDNSLDPTKNIEDIASRHLVKISKIIKMQSLIDTNSSSLVAITDKTSKIMIDSLISELQSIYGNDKIFKLRIWNDSI